jgi:hypothetical protein
MGGGERMSRARASICALAVGVAAVSLVSTSNAATPDATRLVLQPSDVPSYMKPITAPQLTTRNDGLWLNFHAEGKLSGAVAEYNNPAGLHPPAGQLWQLVSHAQIFSDVGAAHAAFLEAANRIQRSSAGSQLAVASLGQESLSWGYPGANNSSALDRIVWRHGNVLGFVEGNGWAGTDTFGLSYTLAQAQQARIAALVSSNPAPAVAKPVISALVAEPAQPVAGRRFIVGFGMTKNTLGGPLTGVTATSTATIAGKQVPHSSRSRAGEFIVSLVVPESAKGQALAIRVIAKSGNQTTSRVFTYTVRSAPSGESPGKWLWTETYAEKTLMKNLRIPCMYVRQGAAACDVAEAQARVDSWKASQASCEALPTAEQRIKCLSFLISTSHVVQTLENVKNGFKLKSAECSGSGTGIRFGLFRCQVMVSDRDVNTNQPRTVSGRIAVTTTGRATFRWTLI